MRLWSLHPKYLDVKGLVALWREALLAGQVLAGNTRGYRNHPQLCRFRKTGNPLHAVNHYLSEVFFEAEKRGYSFDRNKIDWSFKPVRIPVTTGQLGFERDHLLRKLKQRASEAAVQFELEREVELHPIFELTDGGIEDWEVIES